MDLMDFLENVPFQQSLLLSIDATHPRSHSEQTKIGLDYQIMGILSLRGGYISNNDEEGLSFGAGFNAHYQNYGIVFDYAYTPFGVFDKVQRITTRVSF